ncbi:SEC14-like protein 2 [Orchesella cincta]|uniref:SEC14-like protein 2 n=1 Tax=Orchesella cincta TaxID=48709 RepID=A0A1D2MMD6_ORCCI|nr:SEC14-like protein 2 [Orchesella cincta]
MNIKYLTCLCFFCVIIIPRHVKSDVVDEELILTQKEKTAFDKFKAAVYPKLSLEMMKHDVYLLRWIRAKNLDVQLAERDILEMVKFVRVNKIENIMEEDFGDIMDEFPYHMDIVSFKLSPIGYGSTEGAWDIRRTILQGKRTQLMRYVYRMVFGVMFKVVEINKKQPNVTKFNVLVSFDGFNLVQHMCPLCVSTYITLLQLYERYLPGCAEEIIVINSPTTIHVLLNMLRPFFSESTNRALKIFGPNKTKWKPYRDARIDPNKLPEQFGGNRLDR